MCFWALELHCEFKSTDCILNLIIDIILFRVIQSSLEDSPNKIGAVIG